MKVCVQGLWHLGLVTAGCLASVGYDVVGLDFDEGIVQEILADRIAALSPDLLVLDLNRSLSISATGTKLRHVTVGAPSIQRSS